NKQQQESAAKKEITKKWKLRDEPESDSSSGSEMSEIIMLRNLGMMRVRLRSQ
ncbi:hypothetical protein HAX54_004373, partial [Datura stramonium]|nr:hypothetical protein [Datura stramonium]